MMLIKLGLASIVAGGLIGVPALIAYRSRDVNQDTGDTYRERSSAALDESFHGLRIMVAAVPIGVLIAIVGLMQVVLSR